MNPGGQGSNSRNSFILKILLYICGPKLYL
jgi:hypothetical protein